MGKWVTTLLNKYTETDDWQDTQRYLNLYLCNKHD